MHAKTWLTKKFHHLVQTKIVKSRFLHIRGRWTCWAILDIHNLQTSTFSGRWGGGCNQTLLFKRGTQHDGSNGSSGIWRIERFDCRAVLGRCELEMFDPGAIYRDFQSVKCVFICCIYTRRLSIHCKESKVPWLQDCATVLGNSRVIHSFEIADVMHEREYCCIDATYVRNWVNAFKPASRGHFLCLLNLSWNMVGKFFPWSALGIFSDERFFFVAPLSCVIFRRNGLLALFYFRPDDPGIPRLQG